MKDCKEYLDLILRSLDGETSAVEEASLQAHLETCEDCQAVYAAWKAVDISIQNTEEEPPEQLRTAVMDRIHRESTGFQPKHMFQRFRFTMVAAAAAVVLLVVARTGNLQFTGAEQNTAADTTVQIAAPEQTAFDAEFAEAPGAEVAPAVIAEEGAGATGIAAEAPAVGAMSEEVTDQGSVNLSEADVFLVECIAAMEAEGETHTVLVLEGIDEAGLQELIPDLSIHALGELTAYAASQEQVNLASDAGEITIAASLVLETGPQDPVWIFLLHR